MRVAFFAIAFATAALVASPLSGAMGKDLNSPNTLVVIRTSSGSAVLGWTPAPDAVLYVVYGGVEPERMTEIARTTSPAYVDGWSSEDTLYYRVAGVDASGQTGSSPTVGSGYGSCLSTSSTYHVSVNVYNCLSWVP